ncbi:unnamed protein product [Ectocarpus sp. CCAP 1310/34]|nr:unnamed protein product [Ectocarpus sp. CCAP 1310/34]
MSGDNHPPLPSVQEPTEAGTTAVAAAGGEAPMGMSSIAGGGVGLGMLADGADVDDDPDAVLAVCGAPGGGGGGGLGGEAGDGRGGEELEAEEQRYGSGWVVTQASLNGVARYAGHALQIMALVRPAAPSAFGGLRQLVDLYLYCALTLFCPEWAIDGPSTASATRSWCRPRRSKRRGFTALKSFLSRVSHDLSNPKSAAGSGNNNGDGSRETSPAHSPERSSSAGGKDGNASSSRTPTTGDGDERRRRSSSGATRSATRRRGRSAAAPSPTATAVAANSEAEVTEGEAAVSTTLAGAVASLRDRVGGSGGGGGGGAKGGLDGLLLAGSESLFGGDGGGSGGRDRGSLERSVEWRSLGQRAVAVESCLFVLQVLKAARRRTTGGAAAVFDAAGLGLLPVSQRAAVDAYVAEIEQVTAQLRSFAYWAQAPGLVGGEGIAAAVEGQSWTRKKIRNDASPYVEEWITRCLLIRGAIYPPSQTPPSPPPPPPDAGNGSSPDADSATTAVDAPAAAAAAAVAAAAGTERSATDRRGRGGRGGSAGSGGAGGGTADGTVGSVIPARARRLVWRRVVDALLLSLLRGFSRVRRCSTEGRALMSMDLQALALGLEDPAATHAAKAHVHAYVNAFYFGDEDLHKWIKERWRSYPMYQMVSLLQCADGAVASKVLRKRRVKDLVAQVEALYLPCLKESGGGTGASSRQPARAKTGSTTGTPPGAVHGAPTSGGRSGGGSSSGGGHDNNCRPPSPACE